VLRICVWRIFMCVGLVAAKGLYGIVRYTIKWLLLWISMGTKKKEHFKCNSKSCVDCKQAICGLKVFCCWLKEFVDKPHVDDGIEVVVCPRFEIEPLEYKVYRRT
jgi:hypothetical protein